MKPDIFDPAKGVLFALVVGTVFWAAIAVLLAVVWRCF